MLHEKNLPWSIFERRNFPLGMFYLLWKSRTEIIRKSHIPYIHTISLVLTHWTQHSNNCHAWHRLHLPLSRSKRSHITKVRDSRVERQWSEHLERGITGITFWYCCVWPSYTYCCTIHTYCYLGLRYSFAWNTCSCAGNKSKLGHTTIPRSCPSYTFLWVRRKVEQPT